MVLADVLQASISLGSLVYYLPSLGDLMHFSISKALISSVKRLLSFGLTQHFWVYLAPDLFYHKTVI